MLRSANVLILLMISGGLLAASPLDIHFTASAKQNADQSFTYSYSLDNNTDSSEDVFALSLGYMGVLTGITSPLNWTTVSESGYLSWVSEDPASDLAPGGLDNFSFTSLLAPVSESFSVFGSDPSTGFPTGDMVSGTTIGPASSVPEPGTFALLSVASLLIALHARARLRDLRQGLHRYAAVIVFVALSASIGAQTLVRPAPVQYYGYGAFRSVAHYFSFQGRSYCYYRSQYYVLDSGSYRLTSSPLPRQYPYPSTQPYYSAPNQPSVRSGYTTPAYPATQTGYPAQTYPPPQRYYPPPQTYPAAQPSYPTPAYPVRPVESSVPVAQSAYQQAAPQQSGPAQEAPQTQPQQKQPPAPQPDVTLKDVFSGVSSIATIIKGLNDLDWIIDYVAALF